MKTDDLYTIAARYKAPLLRRKWTIIICSLILGTCLALWAYFSPYQYIATTVFHPATDEVGSGLDLSNPLAILAGGASASASDQQMIGVLQSQSINQSVASDTVVWKGKAFLLADLIIEHTPKKLISLKRIFSLFQSQDSITITQKTTRAAKLLMKNQVAEVNEHGFIDHSIRFYEKDLSQLIAEKYIEELIDYYTKQKTEKAKTNVAFFTERADSIKQELDLVAASRARVVDQEQYRIFARDQISTAELDIKLDMLKEMYIQLVASREQFIAQLKRVTPIIQVLDPPIPPFEKEKTSILKAFLGGVFLVVFLFTVWLTKGEWIPDLRHLIISTIDGKSSRTEEG